MLNIHKMTEEEFRDKFLFSKGKGFDGITKITADDLISAIKSFPVHIVKGKSVAEILKNDFKTEVNDGICDHIYEKLHPQNHPDIKILNIDYSNIEPLETLLSHYAFFKANVRGQDFILPLTLADYNDHYKDGALLESMSDNNLCQFVLAAALSSQLFAQGVKSGSVFEAYKKSYIEYQAKIEEDYNAPRRKRKTKFVDYTDEAKETEWNTVFLTDMQEICLDDILDCLSGVFDNMCQEDFDALNPLQNNVNTL